MRILIKKNVLIKYGLVSYSRGLSKVLQMYVFVFEYRNFNNVGYIQGDQLFWTSILLHIRIYLVN